MSASRDVGEILAHMNTSDGVFVSLHEAITKNEPWQGAEDLQGLIDRLDLEKKTCAEDEAAFKRQYELLEAEIERLSHLATEKEVSFEQVQGMFRAKQRIDKQIAEFERPKRVNYNGKEILALLNQPRRRDMETIEQLETEISQLEHEEQELQAAIDRRADLFKKIDNEIRDFEQAIKNMDPDNINEL